MTIDFSSCELGSSQTDMVESAVYSWAKRAIERAKPVVRIYGTDVTPEEKAAADAWNDALKAYETEIRKELGLTKGGE